MGSSGRFARNRAEASHKCEVVASQATHALNRGLSRKLIPIDRSRHNSAAKSPEEGLLSALLAQEDELSNILDEVGEVSMTFGSDGPQTEALSKTLQRAVSCAVKQSLLGRELQSLALVDDLTGLYNRRAFLALAAQQFRVAMRKNQGLWLFFADVDYMKEINDTYGHQEGDLALVRTADVLEETFRDSDICARLGGDEFAVLALEAPNQHKNTMLRRLEKKLKSSNTGKVLYELSLSIGAARFDPKKPVSLEQLLTQADQSMYREKKDRSRYWPVASMH
jgi:diguanylate cyclase (GGDEF)-like protein